MHSVSDIVRFLRLVGIESATFFGFMSMTESDDRLMDDGILSDWADAVDQRSLVLVVPYECSG